MCVLKGNKPDFHKAMDGEKSQQFYEDFLAEMRHRYQPEKIKGLHTKLDILSIKNGCVKCQHYMNYFILF